MNHNFITDLQIYCKCFSTENVQFAFVHCSVTCHAVRCFFVTGKMFHIWRTSVIWISITVVFGTITAVAIATFVYIRRGDVYFPLIHLDAK